MAGMYGHEGLLKKCIAEAIHLVSFNSELNMHLSESKLTTADLINSRIY